MFFKIKKNIHRIKNIKKHVLYRKIKNIKYVLNNYDRKYKSKTENRTDTRCVEQINTLTNNAASY